MKFLFASILLMFSQITFAISFKDAWLNIFYFEHAKQSSSHCVRLGFPSGTALASWQAKNAFLHREAMAIVRSDAVSRGLNKSELEAVIAEAIDNQRKIAKEHIEKDGVKCAKFDGVLRMYDELFIR